MEYNPFILVPLATWAIAQVSKFALAALRGRIDFRYLYASGGMPSVHSAVVCSLAVTALLVEGMNSHLFGLAVIVAVIVMYDSFGVRRAAGEQAAAINMLIESLDRSRVKLEQPRLHLREILGHQPREVAVGAVLGVVLGAVFNYEKLGGLTAFLQTFPGKPEVYAYAGIFAALLIGGLIARIVMRKLYPKSAVMKKVSKQWLVFTQTTGWVGLGLSLLVYERASYLGWRIWPVGLLVIVVTWAGVLLVQAAQRVPESLEQEAETARKRKWLNWGRGRKNKRK